MKILATVTVIVLACWLAYSLMAAARGPNLTISGDEVLLATAQLDARFSQTGPFHETYMLFGGLHLDHPNAVSSVSFAGLDVGDVQRIAARYPDFYMCKSQGAPLAQRSIVELDLVPADGGTLETLKSALDEFSDNLSSGGDRVCVSLDGKRLNLESVKVREAGESVTRHYAKNHFYLVTSAEIVDCRTAG